jgi:hypothetical protein
MKKYVVIILVIILLIPIGFKIKNTFFYSGELVGIKGTNVYHRDDCKFIKESSSTSIYFINNLDETAEKELRPCKRCNPPDNSKFVTEYNKLKEEKEKDRLLSVKNDYLNGKNIQKSDLNKLISDGYLSKEEIQVAKEKIKPSVKGNNQGINWDQVRGLDEANVREWQELTRETNINEN